MQVSQTAVTEKIIAAFEARRFFGKVLDGVKAGDKFVVEEYKEPVAAIIPLSIYNQWKQERKQERERFFAIRREAAETANLPEDEADRLSTETVKAVRAQAKKV